jgi:hypothetical protein
MYIHIHIHTEDTGDLEMDMICIYVCINMYINTTYINIYIYIHTDDTGDLETDMRVWAEGQEKLFSMAEARIHFLTFRRITVVKAFDNLLERNFIMRDERRGRLFTTSKQIESRLTVSDVNSSVALGNEATGKGGGNTTIYTYVNI